MAAVELIRDDYSKNWYYYNELYSRGEKMAKVMGELATNKPKHGERLSGILVKRNFNYHVIAPSDLEGTMLTLLQSLYIIATI